MRYKAPFSLLARKLKSGKKTIYYYRVYDTEGKRKTYSTGCTTKTSAREYCLSLYKAGKLIPNRKTKDITFEEYSKDWWIWDKCSYIKSRLARGGSISRTYADINRGNLDNHIIPQFGSYSVNTISVGDIEKWLLSFSKKKLSNTTANHNLKTLRIMLSEAKRLELIITNPAEAVKPLKEIPKQRGIINPIEFKELFNMDNSETIWDNPIAYAGNLLSAITGLRQGEVLALKYADLYIDHIDVKNSWDRNYGLKDTKTHEERSIPIPEYIFSILTQLNNTEHEGFIFSIDGGKYLLVAIC